MKNENEEPKKTRKRRSPTNYKLGEKDHKTIIEGLRRFVPIYVLAAKIGCDYNTLRRYIKANDELNQCRKDAEDNMVAVAKGQLMKRVLNGHPNSIMFLLERLDRQHFGRFAQIENIGDLPAINIGVFNDTPAPVDPTDVGSDAASILTNAAKMAKRQAEIEELAEATGDDEAQQADD